MREKENRGGEQGGYGSKMCPSHLIVFFFFFILRENKKKFRKG